MSSSASANSCARSNGAIARTSCESAMSEARADSCVDRAAPRSVTSPSRSCVWSTSGRTACPLIRLDALIQPSDE